MKSGPLRLGSERRAEDVPVQLSKQGFLEQAVTFESKGQNVTEALKDSNWIHSDINGPAGITQSIRD